MLTISSIVEQQDSWSKFLTTQAIFEQILTSKHVFCDYLNFVCAFGSKVNQVDDDNKACDGFARDLEFDDNNPLLSPTAYRKHHDPSLLIAVCKRTVRVLL